MIALKLFGEKMNNSPDPTPHSPEQVAGNPDYEVMRDYNPGSYYPSADEIVVKHKKSETFWRAVYAVREDDSDFDCSTTWRQVVPKKITITQYDIVQEKR